jgi:catechol 2,3-dioxygenase-like lactoylglutathione lyase family enzyme
MEQRLSLVTLGVADLERARRFYEDGLGWRRGNNHPEVVFYQIGGAVLALWRRDALAQDAHLPDAGSGFGGIALAYNARTREEVDAVLAEAEAAGAKILKPAEDAFWGGYSGYFADPDGHVWEVAWNPEWTIADDGSVRLGRRSGP